MKFIARINSEAPVTLEAASANAAVDAARALCTKPGPHAVEVATEEGEPISVFGLHVPGEEEVSP